MGRGSGSRPSIGGSAEFDSAVRFEIFSLEADGQTPSDFNGAIENVEIFFSQNITEEDYTFNFGGENRRLTRLSASELDLQTRFIQAGLPVTLNGDRVSVITNYGNREDNPSTPEDENLAVFVPLTAESDRIEFSFVSNNNDLANAGLAEVTLLIEDVQPDIPGFQAEIIDGSSTSTIIQIENPNDAISSIQNIIDNNLFSLTNRVRVSAINDDNPNQIVSLEREIGDGSLIPGLDENGVGVVSGPIAPEAAGDFASTFENTATPINVLRNDNVGIIESFDLISTSGGSVVLSEDLLIYTPAAGFTGQDTFQYTIDTIDNLGLESTATVTVDVLEEPPTIVVDAVNDSASTQENTAVSIDVLANDSGGDTLSSFSSTSASGGSVVQNGNLLEYIPANGFTGQDSFEYTISNNGVQDTATVTIDVTEAPILDGDDVISGDNGNNILLGGEGNNILYGFDGDDFLQTGSGSDNLQGNNGNDTLSAGGGNDIITGGDGNDFIDGGDGNDTIDAGSQDDFVFGGSGDDLINGGNGNDTLNGGDGNDVLVGDGGSDVFVLNALGGNDTIRDFNFDHDAIGLSNGITFDQITITQGNGAALVNFNGQTIGSISGGTPSQFDASRFIAV